MLKTYQIETKLFEFSQDMERQELMKIRKNDGTLQSLQLAMTQNHVAMAM